MHATATLKQHLSTPRNIGIAMHARPDADAFGTSLALALFLRKQGHAVRVLAPTDYPGFLSWLPDAHTVLVAEGESQEALTEKIGPLDLLFCVDFSTKGRMGNLAFLLEASTALKVVVDHHADPENFADLLFWDPSAAASAQIAFQLLQEWGEGCVTKEIATCLYVGILTDTNSFKNPNTTAQTHRIAAALMEYGIDAAKIQRLIYDNRSIGRLLFFGFAFGHRLVYLPDWQAAYFAIREADCERYGLQNGDTEGLVDYALSLKGISLGAVLREKEGTVHISLRSVGDFSVKAMAQQYFQGGGHKNAAGGLFEGSLTEAVAYFENILRQEGR